MTKLAVLDFETTGLDPAYDEVLQASVIDENGTVLMNEFFAPQRVTQWPDAEKVNGISPADVLGLPPFESAAARLREILESADAVIAYNDSFERSFLDAYGIPSKSLSWGEDPMLTFAAALGGPKRTLSFAAKFFDFSFSAHDALEDVRATLYLYQRMQGGLVHNLMRSAAPAWGETPNGPASYKVPEPGDLLRIQKCLGLAPASAAEPRRLWYKGIYTKQPVECECVGFSDRGGAGDWLVVALEAHGVTYLVCDDHLRDMQSASFGAPASGPADAANGEAQPAPAAKKPAARRSTAKPARSGAADNSRFRSFAQKSAALKNIQTNENADPENPLFGRSIVFTGDLSLSREEAAAAAAQFGALIKSAVSGKTDYLVVGAQDPGLVAADGRSGKEAKAAALNEAGKAHIAILHEEEFLALLQRAKGV